MLRLKHVWNVFPIPSKTKLVWNRLTSSRLATFYFILTVTHCLVQVGLQLTAHQVNHNAVTLLDRLVTAAGLQSHNFTLFDPNLRVLESCWGIPRAGSEETCIILWAANGTAIPSRDFQSSASLAQPTATVTSTSSAIRSTTIPAVQPTRKPDYDDGDGEDDDIKLSSAAGKRATAAIHHRRQGQVSASVRAIGISPITEPTDNATIASLEVVGLDGSGPVTLTRECVSVLRWPLQTLNNTQREDIVFICFQFWVLGMSFVALLNESIPHIIAALLTHVLATMWSGFQLANTQNFRSSFLSLTVDGACKGVNLLPKYWKLRGGAEISILALNAAALLISALLSWKIIKVFGWATFRRIGADRKINRIYTVVLLMTIFLQLSLFFIVTTMALWIDQLCFGAIGRFASHIKVYQAIDIVTPVTLIPWLALGWFGVRQESRGMMYAFFGISIFLLGQWALSFLSPAWRLTFVNWDFFAIMNIIAAVLTIGVIVLGLICFGNFGEGLSNYLKPEEKMPGEDFERITKSDLEYMVVDRSSNASSMDEKIAFPPPASIVPAFNTPFGAVDRDPVTIRQMNLRDLAPSAMISGPKPRSKTGSPPQLASPERVLVGPARRNSGSSSSSRESDSNPFHLADRLSYVAPGKPQTTTSRWSKDSSVGPASWKRWLIE